MPLPLISQSSQILRSYRPRSSRRNPLLQKNLGDRLDAQPIHACAQLLQIILWHRRSPNSSLNAGGQSRCDNEERAQPELRSCAFLALGPAMCRDSNPVAADRESLRTHERFSAVSPKGQLPYPRQPCFQRASPFPCRFNQLYTSVLTCQWVSSVGAPPYSEGVRTSFSPSRRHRRSF